MSSTKFPTKNQAPRTIGSRVCFLVSEAMTAALCLFAGLAVARWLF